MNGFSKTIIMGTLGKDPEIKYMPNGNAVANMTVVTSEKFKDKQSGEMKEIAEWHRITMFGRPAEICGEYLKKGSIALFEGKNKTRSYEKDGITRYSTDVICHSMTMISGNRDNPAQGESRGPATSQAPTDSAAAPATDNKTAGGDGFDDIPFAPIDYRTA